MRHEPPVITGPVLGGAHTATAGPVLTPDDWSRRLSQDHAPRRGMSMILTKAAFIIIGLAAGMAGVVACFGSIEGVMIGVPLIMLGFGCAYGFFVGRDLNITTETDNATDTADDWFIATGEIREHDQVTNGETRFAGTA